MILLYILESFDKDDNQKWEWVVQVVYMFFDVWKVCYFLWVFSPEKNWDGFCNHRGGGGRLKGNKSIQKSTHKRMEILVFLAKKSGNNIIFLPCFFRKKRLQKAIKIIVVFSLAKSHTARSPTKKSSGSQWEKEFMTILVGASFWLTFMIHCYSVLAGPNIQSW